ncbi:MAG: hypothetical protein KY437_11395 [Actinobacteria bacterium]|nr:hypothetical protein [Actinomycetota bacterium]
MVERRHLRSPGRFEERHEAGVDDTGSEVRVRLLQDALYKQRARLYWEVAETRRRRLHRLSPELAYPDMSACSSTMVKGYGKVPAGRLVAYYDDDRTEDPGARGTRVRRDRARWRLGG